MPRKPLTRLGAVEREEKSALAVKLSAQGWNYSQIGEHPDIDLDRRTVKKLIGDEYANRAEHRDQDKEEAIAVYDALIAEGWERLAKLKDSRSYSVSALLNSIKAAQDSKNKITGAEAPIKIDDRNRREPTPTEREANELADEIAALEADIAREEAEAFGAQEGAG